MSKMPTKSASKSLEPTIECEVKPQINKVSTTRFHCKIENFATKKAKDVSELEFKIPGITTCYLQVHPERKSATGSFVLLVFKVADTFEGNNKSRHLRFEVQSVRNTVIWSGHFDYTRNVEKVHDSFLNRSYLGIYLEDGALKLQGAVTITERGWDMVEEAVIADGAVNKLVEDIQSLESQGHFSDFKFLVEGREFDVHKAILAARSPVFERMFSGSFSEAKGTAQKIEGIKASVFEEFLHFCYGGRLTNTDFPARELILVADRYQITDLVALCEVKLLNELNHETAEEIFFVVSQIPSYTELKKTAFDILQCMFKTTFSLPDECVNDPERVRQALELKRQLDEFIPQKPKPIILAKQVRPSALNRAYRVVPKDNDRLQRK